MKKVMMRFNSIKDFMIYANEEGFSELETTEIAINLFIINFEDWLSKEKRRTDEQGSIRNYLTEDVLFEFLKFNQGIDMKIKIEHDFDFIINALKDANTEEDLEKLIPVIIFGYRSNNLSRFVKGNDLVGLFRNMISRYYNLNTIHKSGELFLSNFFDWFYNDIIPLAKNNSMNSGVDVSQNLRLFGKFELKLAEKLQNEFPQYSECILNSIEDSSKDYRIQLKWNGQKNQLYDVFRQLKSKYNNNGQTMLGNSYSDIAQFIVSNVEGFSNNSIGTIIDELERKDRPKKDPIDIVL